MRGTLDQSAFQDAILQVQGITQTKLSNPIIENVVLKFDEDQAEVLATNLSISIRIVLPLENAEPGQTALPARLLGQIVRELPSGPVGITLAERQLLIEAERSRFRVSTTPTEDFPPFLPEVEGTRIDIPVEIASPGIEKTVFATSDERSRFQLGGIKFIHKGGTLEFVATDGRRLSRVKNALEIPPSEDCSMLVPARTAQELVRALPDSGNLRITVGDKRVLFETERMTLASTLLEDNFPPYESLIPEKCPIEIKTDRDELLAAVRRASVLANEKTHLVHFQCESGTLHITGERQEAGGAASEVDASATVDSVQGSYNATYLMECLKAIGPGEIVWGLLEDGGAAYFYREGDDSFLHIIMPMAVRDETGTNDDL